MDSLSNQTSAHIRPLPPGFVVRHICLDDLDAVTDLMLACELADYGRNEYTRAGLRESILQLWQAESMDLAENSWLIVSPAGQCVGRVNLWFSSYEPTEMYASPRIHPAFTGLGLGTHLLHLAEARACNLVQHLSTTQPYRLNSWVEGVNPLAASLLSEQGFTPLRYYWRLELQMQDTPAVPHLPPGMLIRTMLPGEERQVFAAYEEAFQDHWGHVSEDFDEWSYWSFQEAMFEANLWFLAFDGSELAGLALCRQEAGEAEATGIIDDLAVRRPWRKQGLSLALLQHAFGAFYQRGLRRCVLSVDSENTSGATRLYERAGMQRSRRVDVRYAKVLS